MTDTADNGEGKEAVAPSGEPPVILTMVDFTSLDIDSAIQESGSNECDHYCTAFSKRVAEAKNRGNTRASAAWKLLHNFCFLLFRPSRWHDPFEPMMVLTDGSRSFLPDDLTEEERKLVRELAPTISDADLQARFADIGWLVTRDVACARLAIDAYLASAGKLEDPENWPPYVERVQRALRLAVALGEKDSSRDQVVQMIDTTVRKYDGEDPSFLTAKLMELLLDVHEGDPHSFADIAEKAARQAEREGNWHRARSYWKVASDWYIRAEKSEEHRIGMIRYAETYAKEADAAIKTSEIGYLAATFHLQKAIEAFRRVGNQKERVSQLHARLLDYEQRAVGAIKAIEIPGVDASEIVAAARKAVSGLDLSTALMRFAFLVAPTDYEKTRETAIQLAEKHPLQGLFAGLVLDRSGKVVTRQPPMISCDAEQLKRAQWFQVLQQASISQSLNVQSSLDPARNQILMEHRVDEESFADFLVDNPFVPPGHEQLFVQGLYSGMIGEMAAALHYLVPQVENSLRYVLEKNQVITSTIDNYGIQENKPLDVLLRMKKTEEIFSKDMVLDLRSVLTERGGPNIRHKLAHGQLGYNECFSVYGLYAWWLILRLCCIPARVAEINAEKQAASSV